MNTIEELAKLLGITEKSLEGMRRKYRMKHGEEADEKLLRSLTSMYEDCRDKVRLLGKSGGYTESFAGALHIRGVEGEQEPESVPEAYQTLISAEATAVFEIVKGEAKAKREARSRAERLRQAELELRQKGKSHEHYAQVVDAAIAAMKQEARVA